MGTVEQVDRTDTAEPGVDRSRTVEQVDRDTRGIVDPATALARFGLTRHAPGAPVARLVDRYWVVRWALPPGERHEQVVLVHPVTNLVIEEEHASGGGVQTRPFTRALEGSGLAVGIMFRPGGFRALVDVPMSDLTDRTLPLDALLGPAADLLASAVHAAGDDDAAIVAALDRELSALVPPAPHPCERTAALVERLAADRSIRRVDELAALAGTSVRSLQRAFADHVGVGPKWVIRRYRLYDAAEQAARGLDVPWAQVAADLGYADQSHLVRDFTEAIGETPERYARRCAAARAGVGTPLAGTRRG